MADVVLDFAGWRFPRNQVHRAIGELESGDPLFLVRQGSHWKVLDRKRRQVGRMARSWAVTQGMEILRADVHGVFSRWAKDQKDKQYASRLQSESWEVVIPRIALTPAPQTPSR